MKRQSNKQKDDFVLLKNVFDISHKDVDKMVDKDKVIFLCNPRKDGRVGYIANIETVYDEMERKKLEEERHRQQLMNSEQEKQRSGEIFLTKNKVIKKLFKFDK